MSSIGNDGKKLLGKAWGHSQLLCLVIFKTLFFLVVYFLFLVLTLKLVEMIRLVLRFFGGWFNRQRFFLEQSLLASPMQGARVVPNFLHESSIEFWRPEKSSQH